MGLFKRFKKKNETEPAKPLTPKAESRPVEVIKFETRKAFIEITKEEGKPPIKKVKRKEIPPNELTELDHLKDKQANYYNRLSGEEGYYGSEESKMDIKKINKELEDYLERNPKDYVTRGINHYTMLWEYSDLVPAEEVEIFRLTGEGLYYEENLKDYPKAIETYQKGVNLTLEFMKDEIEKLVEEHGEGDYLYTAKLKNRIRVCEHKLEREGIKKLEAEAKELEETNPMEAIKKYGELNRINPNLKKYDKRIARIVEKMAKEREETDPQGAIALYNKLNEINPNVKKYNKRIEILEKRL